MSDTNASAKPEAGEGVLRPQSVLLTLLGDYCLKEGDDEIWSGGLVELAARLGCSDAATRMALSRLTAKGLLRRKKSGRATAYSPSPAGRLLLREGRERLLSFGETEVWDGQWTLLTYSIPEERRNLREVLRKRLQFLGFSPVHQATWIAPRQRASAVSALLAELALEDHAELFIGCPVSAETITKRLFAERDLTALDLAYEDFVNEFAGYEGASARAHLTDEEAFVLRARMTDAYRQFPNKDPAWP
jgi:phenylacetic acid degradation operon negative regulatory protein